MGKLILISGGARGGKSAFAESLARADAAPRAYVATAPALDAEMEERIRRHRERRGDAFFTIEEQFDLCSALVRARVQGAKTVLLDCLTLWINNLAYRAEKAGGAFRETDAAREAQDFVDAARAFPGTVICVINEVGLGVVPDNAAARNFRDCSGRCGQIVAAAADEVHFCLLGIARRMK